MKNELIRAALAMTAFGTVLLSLGCQGDGVNQNANTGREPSIAANESPSPSADPCSGTTEEKVRKINAAIDAELNAGDEGLKQQKKDGKFSISANQVSNTSVISITVTGKVAGDGKFKEFVKVFDKYLTKGCVQVAKFEPKNTNMNTSSNSATKTVMASTGFLWTLCEEPQVLCSNGECLDKCPDGVVLLNSISSSNTNSNLKTNSNSNKGNTNKP